MAQLPNVSSTLAASPCVAAQNKGVQRVRLNSTVENQIMVLLGTCLVLGVPEKGAGFVPYSLFLMACREPDGTINEKSLQCPLPSRWKSRKSEALSDLICVVTAAMTVPLRGK